MMVHLQSACARNILKPSIHRAAMPLISNVWIPLVLREQSLDSLDQIEVFDSADHFILKSFLSTLV